MGKLYDKHLKAVLNKTHTKVFTLTDGKGLGARVSKKGKVRWQYRYKINGKNMRLDIGYYPDLSLLKAREEAQQCRTWLVEGYDPKKKRLLEREKLLKPVSVQDALEYWLTEFAQDHRKNVDKHRAQFAKHIYPYIGSIPLEQAETRHWLECFDRIRKGVKGKQKEAPVASGYVLTHAKQALRFCRAREYATSHALDDLVITDVGRKQNQRDRVLTNKELADVCTLMSSNKLKVYYQNLVRFLVLFGCRTQEIRLSTWREWDFSELIWTAPGAHTKSGKKVIRPIPESLVPWLMGLKSSSNSESLVLQELKTGPTVSQFVRQLWKRLNHNEKWTAHDFRRTLATHMSDLGVAPYVVEQLLDHSLGGVMQIYNRSQFIPEKKEALAMWHKRVESLIQT